MREVRETFAGSLTRVRYKPRCLNATKNAGLVVLEESSDPERDIYAEPRLLHFIGNVPAEMIEALAA